MTLLTDGDTPQGIAIYSLSIDTRRHGQGGPVAAGGKIHLRNSGTVGRLSEWESKVRDGLPQSHFKNLARFTQFSNSIFMVNLRKNRVSQGM